MTSRQRIGIFVATMTGTAELCAAEVASVLKGEGFECGTQLTDGLGVEAIRAFDLVVIVSSTYGHGDVPDNGQALFAAIEAADGLVGLRFAVFGLGDRTYATTFCEGGRKWDALLAAKGATRVAPLRQHDASSGTLAEDEAAAWAAGWVSLLREAA